jgi:hypothetical protein
MNEAGNRKTVSPLQRGSFPGAAGFSLRPVPRYGVVSVTWSNFSCVIGSWTPPAVPAKPT